MGSEMCIRDRSYSGLSAGLPDCFPHQQACRASAGGRLIQDSRAGISPPERKQIAFMAAKANQQTEAEMQPQDSAAEAQDNDAAQQTLKTLMRLGKERATSPMTS